jgi:hypothetical protein
MGANGSSIRISCQLNIRYGIMTRTVVKSRVFRRIRKGWRRLALYPANRDSRVGVYRTGGHINEQESLYISHGGARDY